MISFIFKNYSMYLETNPANYSLAHFVVKVMTFCSLLTSNYINPMFPPSPLCSVCFAQKQIFKLSSSSDDAMVQILQSLKSSSILSSVIPCNSSADMILVMHALNYYLNTLLAFLAKVIRTSRFPIRNPLQNHPLLTF